jgi:hypothetical protein
MITFTSWTRRFSILAAGFLPAATVSGQLAFQLTVADLSLFSSALHTSFRAEMTSQINNRLGACHLSSFATVRPPGRTGC